MTDQLDRRHATPPRLSTAATAVARQPQQAVRWPKAPIRTRQDGDLMVLGKHLEQQVSMRRQRESDRRDGRDDVTHREYQLPCQRQ
jgi:hypothetical protein